MHILLLNISSANACGKGVNWEILLSTCWCWFIMPCLCIGELFGDRVGDICCSWGLNANVPFVIAISGGVFAWTWTWERAEELPMLQSEPRRFVGCSSLYWREYFYSKKPENLITVFEILFDDSGTKPKFGKLNKIER